MRLILKLNDALATVEKALVVFLFSTLIFLIVFNVITRNIFNLSFQKLLEITPGFVLWLTLFGTTLALKNRRHIKLELMLRHLRRRNRYLARIMSSIFGMAVMGVLFVASFDFVKNEIEIFGHGGWTAVIFPVFFALLFFRYAVQTVLSGSAGNESRPGMSNQDKSS